MTLKRWVLGKVNGAGNGKRRGDGRIAPSLHDDPDVNGRAGAPGRREMGVRRESLREAAHLGRYALLVTAIRHELEQFVANEVRLHLAIAERDRFVLTSIEVECEESEENRELLRRFMREFKPEQIKQYLARDVIAGLRNASAIDLAQFAGLNANREDAGVDEEEDPYAELVAQLQSSSPEQGVKPYEVRLLGRWTEQSALAVSPPARHESARNEMPQTPLAARTFTFEVTDGAGARSLDLAVVPGRRYTIGKDEACDIVLDGTYASRRHCEIWLDQNRWWIADAGSTNGIRVEGNGTVQRRIMSDGKAAPPLELATGASLVLSAYGDGDAGQYPRVRLPAVDARDPASATTAATPIAPARRARSPWSITAHMASGTRDAEVIANALPFRIGRSRNQSLIIDWTHADVSGRHVEIIGLDDSGAAVLVHGDNGVTVNGTTYATGAQFRWKPGEEMLLGETDGTMPRCRLTLAHGLE